MAASWVEEGALADMKTRLDKLRVDQSRQVHDEKPGKKDTLKILQSKFGSPVYDPTSPLQKAYDRRCARAGRRKSIEFEDLYLSKGSGALQLPVSPASPKVRPGSTGPRKQPLLRSSTTMTLPSPWPASAENLSEHRQPRVRKSSDPTSSKKNDPANSHGLARPKHGGVNPKGQGDCCPKGQGQRGILSVTVSEEDKKLIDQKLAGIGGGEDGAHHPHHHHHSPQQQQQRRRKISGSSKTAPRH